MKKILLVLSSICVVVCLIWQSVVLRASNYTSANFIFPLIDTTKELGSGSKIVDGLLWFVCYVIDPLTYGTVHVICAPIYDLANFFLRDSISDLKPAFVDFIYSGSLTIAVFYWLGCIVGNICLFLLEWFDKN